MVEVLFSAQTISRLSGRDANPLRSLARAGRRHCASRTGLNILGSESPHSLEHDVLGLVEIHRKASNAKRNTSSLELFSLIMLFDVFYSIAYLLWVVGTRRIGRVIWYDECYPYYGRLLFRSCSFRRLEYGERYNVTLMNLTVAQPIGTSIFIGK